MMRCLLLLWLAFARYIEAKAVFAHFMVGNTAGYHDDDWVKDITAAQTAHIDAFALNIAVGDAANDASIPAAFSHAETAGFHLFFSFDYAGGGPWDMKDVTALIKKYSGSKAYFNDGGPLVSTFEGPAYAKNWSQIRTDTGCVFIPDWSSKGAKDAVALGNTDGLFSWAAWPYGPNNMNTYIDASYDNFMPKGAPYMMAASPWFYTNLPFYKKNWLWRGDSLWADRWSEIIWWQPAYVEIISWNDYGESHYIGPIHANDVLTKGKAPFDYVDGMDHDGWRATLPFWIDMYKTGTAAISSEVLSVWYRKNPGSGCNADSTSGNTASQFQVEYNPASIVQDRIYFTAVLTSNAAVSVTIGGTSVPATWSSTPSGGIGAYNGSAPIGSLRGQVVVSVKGMSVSDGPAISSCDGGYTNFNAWAGSSQQAVGTVSPAQNLASQGCIAGWGAGNFGGLCNYTCTYNYCPKGACMCTALGPLKTRAPGSGIAGYPIKGEGSSYVGLCSDACTHDYCPPSACGRTDVGLVEPTVSPFLPPSCTSGTSTFASYVDLCKWSCGFGYCPIERCTCLTTGTLVLALDPDDNDGTPIDTTDRSGLCSFACSRKFCITPPCTPVLADDPGTDPSNKHKLPFPAPTCGSNQNDWTCLLCNNSANYRTVDADHTGGEKWANSKAGDSVAALKTWTKQNQDGGGSSNLPRWIEWVGEFYEAVLPFDCAVAAGYITNCYQDLDCQGIEYPLATFTVLSSIVRLTSFYEQWWQALDDILNKWGTLGDKFKQTFAPDPSERLIDQLNGLLIDQLFDYVGGKLFGAIQARIPLNEDATEKAQEAFDAAYGAVTDKVKGALDSSKEAPSKADIDGMVSNLVHTQQKALTDYYNGYLLSGTTAAIDDLTAQIDGGVWLNVGDFNDSLPDVRNDVRRMILTTLIPQAWNLLEGINPVIVVSNKADDNSYPFNNQGLTKANTDLSKYNYDSHTFWLVASVDCKKYAKPDGPQCQDLPFQFLPGVDQLDATNENWGSLSYQDFIASSWEGYKVNFNLNGYKIADAPDGPFFIDGTRAKSAYPYQSEVRTPGLVSIPVCDIDLVEINHGEIPGNPAGKCDIYPCCSCDWYGVDC